MSFADAYRKIFVSEDVDIVERRMKSVVSKRSFSRCHIKNALHDTLNVTQRQRQSASKAAPFRINCMHYADSFTNCRYVQSSLKCPKISQGHISKRFRATALEQFKASNSTKCNKMYEQEDDLRKFKSETCGCPRRRSRRQQVRVEHDTLYINNGAKLVVRIEPATILSTVCYQFRGKVN